MTKHVVAEAGYYNGKFLRAGDSYHDDGLDDLSREELIAFARDHQIAIDENDTPIPIRNAIREAVATPEG